MKVSTHVGDVSLITCTVSELGAEMTYSLMQFENLVEFDLSGVRIPDELQSQLQVIQL